MNVYLWIGVVGITAALLPNVLARLFWPDIFSPFFTTGWWSGWFPAYVPFVVFLFIGIGFKKKAAGDNTKADETNT